MGKFRPPAVRAGQVQTNFLSIFSEVGRLLLNMHSCFQHLSVLDRHGYTCSPLLMTTASSCNTDSFNCRVSFAIFFYFGFSMLCISIQLLLGLFLLSCLSSVHFSSLVYPSVRSSAPLLLFPSAVFKHLVSFTLCQVLCFLQVVLLSCRCCLFSVQCYSC